MRHLIDAEGRRLPITPAPHAPTGQEVGIVKKGTHSAVSGAARNKSSKRVSKGYAHQGQNRAEAELFLNQWRLHADDNQLLMGKVFDGKTVQELAKLYHKSKSWVLKRLDEPYVKICSSRFETFLKEPRWMRNAQERLLQVSGAGQKRNSSPAFERGRQSGFLFVMLVRRHDQYVSTLNDPSVKQAAVAAAEACKNMLCSVLQDLLFPLTKLPWEAAVQFCGGSTTWVGPWPVNASELDAAAAFYKGFGAGLACKPKEKEEIMQRSLILPLICQNRAEVENMRQRGKSCYLIARFLSKQMPDAAKAACPESQAGDVATFKKFVARVKKTFQRVGLKLRNR